MLKQFCWLLFFTIWTVGSHAEDTISIRVSETALGSTLGIIVTGDITDGLTQRVQKALYAHLVPEGAVQRSPEAERVQAELDESEPGRYIVFTPEQADFYEQEFADGMPPSTESLFFSNFPAYMALREFSEVRLILMSEGGSVYEAMKLGRFVRANELNTSSVVVCRSSCVLVLAAGVDRKVVGEVGIHRPYFEQAPKSGDAGSRLKQVLSEVKLYLEEMNIPADLAEKMFSIPPAQMHRLSLDELRHYRLNQADYVYRENQDLRISESFGISRAEYLEFTNEINSKCGGLPPTEMRACVGEAARERGFPFPQ